MPASNIFQQFAQGQSLAQQRDLRNQQAQLNEQKRQQNLLKLDDQRKGALFQDAQAINTFLKGGDTNSAMGVISNRVNMLEQLGGDPSDTMEIASLIGSGNIEGARNLLDLTEQVGVQQGFLKDPLGSGTSVQSSKILDDGTTIQVMKNGSRRVISASDEVLTGDDARNAVRASNKAVQERKVKLKRLDQQIKREQAKEGLMTDQQKTTQRSNIQRLGSLSNTAAGRASAMKKAIKFRDALKSGQAFSGAGRKAAQFIPGVFTSQGQFDEEFNAFSEVAARQQLKASGETRPTDADVQGMKQAMFGVGRDEQVNVQLLNDFIVDQRSQNDELDQLIGASEGGNLSQFTFNPAQPVQQPIQSQPVINERPLSEMTLEELQALRERGGQ